MKLLILDDDPQICSLLHRVLSREGFECEAFRNPRVALGRFEDQDSPAFDLIILDIMMPEMWGWEFLTRLRERGHDVPVLVLSGREHVEERVRLLQLGADDFLTKPFSIKELFARVHAILRRTWTMPVLSLGSLRLHLLDRKVEVDGEHLELSPKEFDLLRVLLTARGNPVARAELLERVWDIQFNTGTNLVEVHMARLRRKLRDAPSVRIETIPGKGYRLVTAPREPRTGDRTGVQPSR